MRAAAEASSAADNGKLADRLMQSAHGALDRVGAKAAPALEKLNESATSARLTLRAKAEQLAIVQGELLESARAHVRERPFTALAAAALIGALAAKLMRAR
jgi:ElaB/YqjD/DUF883 family membrane-anchored ribosome-binding protein